MEIPFKGERAKPPIKTIPKIIGEPNYKAINEMREALYANSSATSTSLGGGGGEMSTSG